MTTNEPRSTIPLANPTVSERGKAAVESVLDSGQLAAGEVVRNFESEFADYCETARGIATANGTTALHAALEALDIGEGDTVLTTPFTFIATANAVRLAGAEPIFADIDPETYNLDPSSVRRTIRERDGGLDAILAVHLYGRPAPLDRLAGIAEEHDAALIEDCAQAHGARHRGRPVGSVGDVGCFSFYPTKNMTCGEGGMIVTDREDVAEAARRFTDHGRAESYRHVSVGHNFRLSNVAAALGRVQLERLPRLLEQRRTRARRLTEALADSPIRAPTEPDEGRHAYNQYTVRCEQREALASHLEEFGVDTGVYYPLAIHRQPAYEGVSCRAPAAEAATDEVLSVPVHPELSPRDVDTIVRGLRSFEIGESR